MKGWLLAGLGLVIAYIVMKGKQAQAGQTTTTTTLAGSKTVETTSSSASNTTTGTTTSKTSGATSSGAGTANAGTTQQQIKSFTTSYGSPTKGKSYGAIFPKNGICPAGYHLVKGAKTNYSNMPDMCFLSPI